MSGGNGSVAGPFPYRCVTRGPTGGAALVRPAAVRELAGTGHEVRVLDASPRRCGCESSFSPALGQQLRVELNPVRREPMSSTVAGRTRVHDHESRHMVRDHVCSRPAAQARRLPPSVEVPERVEKEERPSGCLMRHNSAWRTRAAVAETTKVCRPGARGLEVCVGVEARTGGAVGECSRRRGRRAGVGAGGGAAEQVECGMRAVVAAGDSETSSRPQAISPTTERRGPQVSSVPRTRRCPRNMVCARIGGAARALDEVGGVDRRVLRLVQ